MMSYTLLKDQLSCIVLHLLSHTNVLLKNRCTSRPWHQIDCFQCIDWLCTFSGTLDWYLIAYLNIYRYNHLLNPKGDGNYADDVDAEFTRYKALGDDVGKGLLAVEVWSVISKIKLGGNLLFKKLSEVALLVLVIPHSNAGEERVFSQVKKNLGDQRSCLNIEKTLNDLLVLKNTPQCEPRHLCSYWWQLRSLLQLLSKKRMTVCFVLY